MPDCQFIDGEDVDRVMVVRDRELRSGLDGRAYLRLTLSDRFGSVSAVLEGQIEEAQALCVKGRPVRVNGCFRVDARHGARLVLESVQAPAPGDVDVDVDVLLHRPPRSAEQMERDLRELIGTVQNAQLRALLDQVFAPSSPAWEEFRDAPAAKHFHQAYRHGLLEHSLTVAQAVSAISATFPGIDRDVAVTGALIHDIGKLEAYRSEALTIDMTDAGKLQGEIPLGYYRIRRLIEDIPDFDPRLATAVLHIILSHHGLLEHGSPVIPCTREATLVHMIDNLGGRLGSFDRLERELPDGSEWSSFDRAIGGGAYFGFHRTEERQAA